MKDDLFGLFREIPGAAISEGSFADGPAVWVGKREIAHLDSDGAFDVRLTKARIAARREALREDPRVVLRRGSSDWLELTITAPEDLQFAVALVREAVTANSLDAPPGPPPSGSELERRRRFH